MSKVNCFTEPEEEEAQEEPSVCDQIIEEDEEPNFMSEPDVDIRPQYNKTVPTRYNPSSGGNCNQKTREVFNSIICQVKDDKKLLEYEDAEAGVLV